MNILRGLLFNFLEFRADLYWQANPEHAARVLQGMGGLMGEW